MRRQFKLNQKNLFTVSNEVDNKLVDDTSFQAEIVNNDFLNGFHRALIADLIHVGIISNIAGFNICVLLVMVVFAICIHGFRNAIFHVKLLESN